MIGRIVLVEDEPDVRWLLERSLTDDGWQVEACPTAEDALPVLDRGWPDVVLVDLNLPGMSGLDLCREIRRRGDLPILVVTARADSHDVVAGLEAGADGYVTKPVATAELSARVRALLRRTDQELPAALHVLAGWTFNVVDRRCTHPDGRSVDLTPTEARLLEELARSVGMVRSRQDLHLAVWGDETLDEGRLVDTHVHRLRVKVDEQLITTVRGMGYRVDP